MRARRFEGERAPDLFPVLAYAPETRTFILDNQTLAFGFVMSPMTGADDGAADRLAVMLNQDWPRDTLIQFVLFASPDIELYLARSGALRAHLPSGLRSAGRKQAFLREHTAKPFERTGGLRSRDLRLAVTVLLPIAGAVPSSVEERQAVEYRDSVEQALATVGLVPQPIDNDALVRLMTVMLNWGEKAGWRDLIEPECDPNRLIREQMLDYDNGVFVDSKGVWLGGEPQADGSHRGGKRVRTLSAKRFPDSMGFGAAMSYLYDWRGSGRGIFQPAIITATLHFPDPENTRTRLAAKRQWATNMAFGPVAKYLPQLGEIKQDFDQLQHAMDNGDRPLRLYLGMTLFCDPGEEQAAVSNARTYWREGGFQLMEDRFFVLPFFLSMLPFGAEREGMRDLMRFRTLFSRQALAILPLFGDWRGNGVPALSLIGRSGQVVALDLFTSDSNYNAVIAAPSGTGKSFLANEIIESYLSMGAQVWVIDVGRSYQKLADSLAGEFVEFSRESRICVNPFPLVERWDEEADVLAALVTAMAAPTESLNDYQMAGMKRVLKRVWDASGHEMSIDQLAEALGGEEDGRLRDIGAQLYPFTRAGEYGRYFTGRNNVTFQSAFTVLELEELKGRKHLQQVVLLQLIYQIQQTMYLGDRDRPKIVLIDEAWDLLTHGDVAKFIEHGYRRFRKYGGAAVVVTQSILDLFGTPTGEAIVNNSAHRLLLAQQGELVEKLKTEKRLPIAEAGYQQLKSVHTVAGAYSEIFCINDRGAGIGRLIVDPFHRLLYSTRAQDVHAIRTLTERGMSVEQAIEVLLEERSRAA